MQIALPRHFEKLSAFPSRTFPPTNQDPHEALLWGEVHEHESVELLLGLRVIHDEDENAPPLLSAEGFRVQVENESTYSGRAGDGEFKEMFRVH